MEEIRKAPFLRVLFPLLAGIIATRYLAPDRVYTWLASILLFILLCIVFYLGRAWVNPYFNRLYGAILQLLFITLGMVCGQNNVPFQGIPATRYTARICEDMVEGDNSYRLVLDRIYYLSDTMSVGLKGKAQVVLQKDQRYAYLKPGMNISARGRLSGWERPGDMEGFDYAAYMTGRGIYYTGYLDSLSWMLFQGKKRRSPGILALNLRQYMMELLKRDQPPGFSEEGAILASLLLGYREGIGEDLKQQFTRSGAMHILAISGLHVGILYLIPALMIRKIRRPYSLRVIVSILSILLLWLYALLTGLSPSVIRAAGMCSIYGVANLARRKTGLLHLLSLAAFIMVMLRPSVIFEAGFQLSFSAVTGIALFYLRLKNLFTFSHWLPGWCWKMTSLSLSAQTGSAPLVIYHFHEYPSYSLLSNLLVIPLATLILYNGILFFSLSWVPALSGLLSMFLHYLCRILNSITECIGQLPGASSGELSISVIQVLILYFIILFIAHYVEYRHTRSLMAVILSLVLFIAVSCYMKVRELKSPVSLSTQNYSIHATNNQEYMLEDNKL